ncbi:Ig-like domain-containing protein [Aureliella helgolandensis]|uniref:Uncharacterized protein n=1 Tax=Aureliella helgolandensis TaxID=2527968 RepID=A0A518GGE4_9BACT|nr:Ig-like domain-containing protein [Aureliella helgolandensis]QDV27618.1 hypothetical protein Q31a_60100 [Aureliella helgolandensis]
MSSRRFTKDQARLQSNRLKAEKIRAKAANSTQQALRQQAEKLAWWQNAFRTPVLSGAWMFSSFYRMWCAFLGWFGAGNPGRPAFAGYHRPTRGRSFLRSILHEPLEDRRLLAVDITGNSLSDDVVNAQEQHAFSISGTASGGVTQVILTVDDGLGGGNPVTRSVPVNSGVWEATGLDVSSMLDTTLSVSVSGVGGNAGTAQRNAWISKDTVAPPIQLPLEISSDDVINIVESTAVKVFGTGAEAGAEVTITFDDGAGFSVSRTVTADGVGGFNNTGTGPGTATPVDLSGVADGAQLTVTATTSDAHGNIGSDSRTIVTDYSAPSAPTIVSPVVGASFNALTSVVTVSGTGALPNGAVAISATGPGGTIQGSPGATADASGNFSATIDLSSLSDGNVQIIVSSVDEAGNPGTSQVAVVLDQTPPVLSLDLVGGADNVVSHAEAVGLIISGASSENGTSVAISITDGVNVTQGFATVAGGLFSSAPINIGALNDGPITVTISNTDSFGNKTVVSGTATKDASAPAIQINTPVAGDNYINADEAPTLTITGQGGDVNAASVPVFSVSDSNGPVQANLPVTLNSDGSFSFSPDLSTAVDGLLTITVTQQDDVGNAGTSSVSVTLDRAAPAQPPTLVSASVNPNGVVQSITSGALTNDNTIRLSGTTTASGLVTIYANGVAVGTGQATGSGATKSWAITTAPLADNTYDFHATLKDIAGNESADSNVLSSIEVDTVDPGISINAPASGQVIGSAISVAGKADGASTVALIFSAGGSQVTTTTNVDANGDWALANVDLTSLADGNVTLLATATDAAGNSHSATAVYSKDTTASTPVISTPIAGDNIANRAEATNLVIQGAGAEPNRPVTISFSQGAHSYTLPGTIMANASGGFTSPAVNLVSQGFGGDAGSAPITVSVTTSDAHGNSATGTASFNVDTVVPGPVVLTSNSWGSDGIINAAEQQSIELAGEGAEPNTLVTISIDDTGANASQTPAVTQSVMSNAAGEFELLAPATSLDLSSLNPGLIMLKITTTDAAGNSSLFSLDLTKDADAPVLTIDANTMGDNRVNALEQTAVIISGIASDGADGTGIVGGTVDILFKHSNGASILVTGVPVAGASYVSPPVDLSSLPDGNIAVTVTAVDNAGNSTTTQPRTLTKDTVQPTLVISTPTDGQLLGDSDAAALVVAGTVSEPNSSVTVLVSDGVNAPIARTITASGSAFTLAGNPIDVRSLNDGPLTITITAADLAGNLGSQSLGVQKDTSAPVVTINGFISGNNLVNQVEASAVTLSGTVTDNGGSPLVGATVQVTFSDGSSSVSRTVSSGAGGAYSFDAQTANITTLNDGPISVKVTVSDAAGNEGLASRTITKDVAAPTIALDDVTSDNVVNASESLKITGVGADPNQGVQITISGPGASVSSSGVFAQSDGTFSWTLSAAQKSSLPDGPLTIVASTADLAGNSGQTQKTVQKDTVAPTLSINLSSVDSMVSAQEAGQVSFSGTVHDAHPNAGSMIGKTVKIVLRDANNGTADIDLFGTVVAGPNNTMVFTTTPKDISSLANGTIRIISATVSDVAGNPSTPLASAIEFQLDKVIPPAPVITAAGVAGSLANNSLTNENMPKIHGTVANNSGGNSWANNVGATVRIYVDGVSVGTTVVQSDGTWNYQIASALNDGSRLFTAKVTDSAGNESGVSNTFALQIDTIAPNLSIDVPIAGDGKINAVESEALTISGVGADPGMTVDITVGSQTQSAIADGNGEYSSVFDISLQSDGPIAISASGTDIAGNVAGTAQVLAEKETVVPVPTITTPIEGDGRVNLAERGHVLIEGTNAEKSRPVVVTFTDVNDMTVTRTVPAADNGDFSLSYNSPTTLANLSTLADGPVTVTATSFDSFGNVGSATTTITLDTVAPGIAIVGLISGDGYVNEDETDAIVFKISGWDSAKPVNVKLTDSTSPNPHVQEFSGVSVANDGTIELDLGASSALVDGTITLVVTNQDVAGNEGIAQQTFKLDRVDPNIEILEKGLIAGDAVVNAAEANSVIIRGRGAHPNSSVEVRFVDSLTGVGQTPDIVRTVQSNGAGEFVLNDPSVNLASLEDGAIEVKVSNFDPAGNQGTDSANLALDTEIDQIMIANPVAGNNVINGGEAVAVIVAGTHAEPGMPVTVTFSDEDPNTPDVVRTVVAQASTGAWTLANNVAGLTGLTDTDRLKITAVSRDSAGNETVAVKEVKLDKAAPGLQIDSPIAGDGYVVGSEKGAVVISGAGAEANSQVSILVSDGSVSRTLSVGADAAGEFSGTFNLNANAGHPNFVDGLVNVSVSNVDASGNIGTSTTSFIIDSTAPLVPGIEIHDDVGSLADNSITNDNTLWLTGGTLGSGGSASFNAEVESVEVFNGSTKLGDAEINPQRTEYSYVTGALPDQLYNFRVKVTDAAGNSSWTGNLQHRVTIDTVAPALGLLSPIAGNDRINAQEAAAGVTVEGSTVPNAEVTITVFNSSGVSLAKYVTAGANGAFSALISASDLSPFSDGTLTVIGETTDAAGNTGFDDVTVVLDREAPTLAFTSHVDGGVINSSQVANVNVAGSLTDNMSVNGQEVTVTISDGTQTLTEVVTVGAGSFALGGQAFDISAFDEGPISLTATAQDRSGNSASHTISLTKDTVTTVPMIDQPIAGDGVVSALEQGAVSITGSQAEANRPVSVVFSDGTKTVSVVGAADGSGAFTLNGPANIASLSDGNINVTVTTQDGAGNASSAMATFVKDTSGPTVTTNLLSASMGGATVITPSSLLSVDNISGPADVVYHITTNPAVGFVALASAPTQQIGTFTQQQIDDGQIVYVNYGNSNVFADSFRFEVSDAVGNKSTGMVNVSVIDVNLPTVESVTINDGANQRSKLKTMRVEFDQQVTGFDAFGAIQVVRQADASGTAGTVGGVMIASEVVGIGANSKTVLTLTFTPNASLVDSTGSLMDGNYRLMINGALVRSLSGGFGLDGDEDGSEGGNFVFGDEAADNFYRLFGEIDGGDATGAAVVDGFDASGFFFSYNSSQGDSNYDSMFDVDEDGFIDGFDASAFFFNYSRERDLDGFNG